MSSFDAQNSKGDHEKEISEIIQGELVREYGANGYRSIIQTMKKICGKSEKEIITNYELFAELAEGVFGRLAESKILDPIKNRLRLLEKKTFNKKK